MLLSEIRITKNSSHGHIEYVISVISYQYVNGLFVFKDRNNKAKYHCGDTRASSHWF